MLKKSETKIFTLTKKKLEDNFKTILEIDQVQLKRFEKWTRENFFTLRPRKFFLSQIAIEQGKVAGFLIASKSGPSCTIHRIAVKEEFGRKGIGSEMMRHFEKKAAIVDCQKIMVGPTLKNSKYVKFYFKNKFTPMTPSAQKKYVKEKFGDSVPLNILGNYLTFWKNVKKNQRVAMNAGFGMKKILNILEKKEIDISQMHALEPFAREGDWQTCVYADKVKSLDAWEINPKCERPLRKNIPNARIKITNSLIEFKKRKHVGKYDFIVIDNPMNCFGPNDKYCEHFDMIPEVCRLLGQKGILIFNINKQPYDYEKNLKLEARRKQFYGRQKTDKLSLRFLLKFYQTLFRQYGYITLFSFDVSRGRYDCNDFFYYLVFHLKADSFK